MFRYKTFVGAVAVNWTGLCIPRNICKLNAGTYINMHDPWFGAIVPDVILSFISMLQNITLVTSRLCDLPEYQAHIYPPNVWHFPSVGNMLNMTVNQWYQMYRTVGLPLLWYYLQAMREEIQGWKRGTTLKTLWNKSFKILKNMQNFRSLWEIPLLSQLL